MTQTTQTTTQQEQENEKSMTHAAGSELAEDDGLTWKQRLFVNAYIGEAEGNATRAAQISGYGVTYDAQRQAGYSLLTKPHIRACVRAAAQAVISETKIIERLAAIATGPYAPIELNGVTRALELLMKYHGMLVDKVEHSGTVEQQVRQIIIHVPIAQTDSKQTDK